VELEVGGRPARPRRFGAEPTGAFRSEIFVEFVDQYWQKDSRPGANPLRLVNRSAQDLEIERVELALW
jgi:hypothetical protein